uniref:Uncharacterized protein n=1 Tax=Oryza barthii TaxID=65489 RepID=A0A0D3GS91_9ORYZ
MRRVLSRRHFWNTMNNTIARIIKAAATPPTTAPMITFLLFLESGSSDAASLRKSVPPPFPLYWSWRLIKSPCQTKQPLLFCRTAGH